MRNCVGERFGRLVVIKEAGRVHKSLRAPMGQRTWLCRCDCGAETVVKDCSLHAGVTKSCGCLHKEIMAVCMTRHGKCGSPEYSAYKGMMKRCHSENSKNSAEYKNYGGRGIKVCKRWRNRPENFIADMGRKPDGTSLDRINSDGPYSPENCRWATRIQQNRNTSRNRLIEFGGKTKCVAEWAEILGIKYSTLMNRLHRHNYSAAYFFIPASRKSNL